MLHYYFKDREELLDCVVEERLCPLLAHVWGPVEAGVDPAELIRGIVQRLLDGIEQMPWVPSTWMREILNEGGLLRERMHAVGSPLKKFGSWAKRSQKDKPPQRLNPETRSAAGRVLHPGTRDASHVDGQSLG